MSRKRGETASWRKKERQRAQNDEPVCRIFFCHRLRLRRRLVPRPSSSSLSRVSYFFSFILHRFSLLPLCMIAPSPAGGSQDQSGISARISSGSGAGQERRERSERMKQEEGKRGRDRTAYPCDTDAPGNHSHPSLLINWHTYLFYSRKETCIPASAAGTVPVILDGGSFGVRDERWE